MKTETSEIQELLFAVLPHWRYRIVKPFKEMLGDGVSLEMYYCIQIIRAYSGMFTMSELARKTRMPKQQTTKLVDKLIQCGFVERVRTLDDRRTVKLKICDKANAYIDNFLDSDAAYFKDFFNNMSLENRTDFADSLKTILKIFEEMSETESKERDNQC